METILNTELKPDYPQKRTEIMKDINSNVYKAVEMSAERYATTKYEKQQLKIAKKESLLVPTHMKERRRNEFVAAILSIKTAGNSNWKITLLN
jgi:chromosome segregation ATPase